MVCGGFGCSKNSLIALNLLYIVSSISSNILQHALTDLLTFFVSQAQSLNHASCGVGVSNGID